MKIYEARFIKILLLLVLNTYLYSAQNIQLIKKENSDSNTTLLVIGGIHGDEPGGYFAASILSTHYKITSNNLWIVPNLNKKSIQADRRGINGDMNRKFSIIKKNDNDKKIIKDIKKIILSKKVSLVLNLHDGHGFYRKENKSRIFNPNAWGQTCVIDQCNLNENQPFGNLNEIASKVKENINKKLLQDHHNFSVKNTKTKFDDEAMQHSLTYFSVTNNKPAFAIESSKNLSSLSQKVFYQLLAIEEFMKIMNISYERDFTLNENQIEKIVNQYGQLRINNNIILNLDGIKKYLSYIPIKSKRNSFEFSHPLGSVKKLGSSSIVYIGNKKLVNIKPQYFKISPTCKSSYDIEIDKSISSLQKGSHFFVNDDFSVVEDEEYRVNIIGYKSKKASSETDVKIDLKSLDKRFSVDIENKIYRIEFYKDEKFCTTLMVHFK